LRLDRLAVLGWMRQLMPAQQDFVYSVVVETQMVVLEQLFLTLQLTKMVAAGLQYLKSLLEKQ